MSEANTRARSLRPHSVDGEFVVRDPDLHDAALVGVLAPRHGSIKLVFETASGDFELIEASGVRLVEVSEFRTQNVVFEVRVRSMADMDAACDCSDLRGWDAAERVLQSNKELLLLVVEPSVGAFVRILCQDASMSNGQRSLELRSSADPTDA